MANKQYKTIYRISVLSGENANEQNIINTDDTRTAHQENIKPNMYLCY